MRQNGVVVHHSSRTVRGMPTHVGCWFRGLGFSVRLGPKSVIVPHSQIDKDRHLWWSLLVGGGPDLSFGFRVTRVH